MLKRNLLGSIVVGTMLVLSGCDSSSGGQVVTSSPSDNSSDPSQAMGTTGTTTGTEGAAGDVISKQSHLLDSNSAGIVDILRYRLRGVDQQLQQSQAVVMIPTGDVPDGGWPVLAWGHGTTGVADSCAPSNSSDLSGYLPYLNVLVSSGFAVVAPDYEGLGNPGSDHPYLNLDSAGYSMLYAVKAAVTAYPQLSTRFATIGHSQGGHAAIGAAELAHEISPLSLLGAVAIAPASHIKSGADMLLGIAENPNVAAEDRADAGVGWLAYASYLLYGLEVTDPSFDASDAYEGENGEALEDAVEELCLADLFSVLYTPVALELQTAGDLDDVLPSSITREDSVQAYMQAIEPGQRAIEAPVLILQGDEDTTVFPVFSRQLRDTMQDAEIEVDYREYSATHGSVVETSATDAVTWLSQLFSRP